jgi:hypothetical protein
MALEIQNQWISVSGDQIEFTFTYAVSQYLVGISSFMLSYAAGTDHHVRQMSISLNQASANQVTVSATVILTDADGNQIDPSQCHLYVSAVAWTGDPTGAHLAPAICSRRRWRRRSRHGNHGTHVHSRRSRGLMPLRLKRSAIRCRVNCSGAPRQS